jgi:subtilisin-like proprotein convertase family protein
MFRTAIAAGLCLVAGIAHADVVCTYSRHFNLRIPANPQDTRGWMNDAVIDVPSHLIIEDLDVSVTLSHSKDFDLTLSLQSPSGTTVTLNYYDPFTGYIEGADYDGTTFDDEASTPIEEGSPPFDGTYRPLEGNQLASFDGQDACGRWRLRVADAYYGDTGWFHSYCLIITVPEPSTVALLLTGMGIAALPWRRRT